MLFLEYGSRKKKLLIFMCVLFFSVSGCRGREEGNLLKVALIHVDFVNLKQRDVVD